MSESWRAVLLIVVRTPLCCMIVFVGLLCAQPDFQSLRVRQLKEILQERGQKCDGCLEKQEYVDRCVETWSLPVVVPAKPTIKPQAKSTTLRAWTRRAERNVILPSTS